MPLQFARVATSIGPMLVAESDRGVAAVARAEDVHAFVETLRRRFGQTPTDDADVDTTWIDAALGGGQLPPIDTTGISRFDRGVYDIVRDIPPGETMTYGEVAALVGAPGAARAVGGSLARCPLFPAVPCHRVVRAADGWSGWGRDDRLKRDLLRRERPPLSD